MFGRHRDGGLACWNYRCVHVAKDEHGEWFLEPRNHAECGMWTTTVPAMILRLAGEAA